MARPKVEQMNKEELKELIEWYTGRIKYCTYLLAEKEGA